MTLDEKLSVVNLEVWNIDPDYSNCEVSVFLTPDGYPYVYVYYQNNPDAVQPVVVPISVLERSTDNYGIVLQ